MAVRINKPADMPVTEHWAVVVYENIKTPDGYGGFYDTSVVQYYPFVTEKEVIEWVEANDLKTFGRLSYSIIRSIPASIKRTVSIEKKS